MGEKEIKNSAYKIPRAICSVTKGTNWHNFFKKKSRILSGVFVLYNFLMTLLNENSDK